MAEEDNHEEAYVRNIRIFKCYTEEYDEEYVEYKGVMVFKTRPRSNLISCSSVPFDLKLLMSLYDEDILDLVEESGLFGDWSGQITSEIYTFLKASFRFVDSGDYDSIVLIVDVANKEIDLDYDAGPTYELEQIASNAAGLYWGVEMEMEEVKANTRVRQAKRKRDDEEENCSICLTETNGGKIAGLKCGHGFHRDCIFKWLSEKSSCPNCRSSCLTISV